MSGEIWRCKLQCGGPYGSDGSEHRGSDFVIVVVKGSEEARDDLEHRSAKAYIVAYNATKDVEALGFRGHGFVAFSLLLKGFLLTETILPLVPLRLPVVCCMLGREQRKRV